MRRKVKKEIMDEDTKDSNTQESSDIKGDEKNILFLFFLYLLQGLPLGLCSAIPMILQNRHVSYTQQAQFSFVNWPFSLKLLWAPVVDSVFIYKFGRRKSWLIPVQSLIGIFMVLLSFYIDDFFNNEGQDLNIGLLTIIFFILNLLAATQDIVVDGWALTMLKRCNVGHASTCNSTGQTAGFFLGYVLFLALESADFCNNYLRSEPADKGIITLSGFMYFWGLLFILTTIFVALFKKETPEETQKSEINMNIKDAYFGLVDIMKLPSIRLMIVVLLTAKIGFAAADQVTSLKLIEAGISKETIALMVLPLMPLNIVFPVIISKYTTGPKPMNFYLKAVPYRLAFGFVSAFLVWVTPRLVHNGHVPFFFFFLLIILYCLHQVVVNSMFVATMAFFAKISDPAVGGTYMTLLNTLSNFGGNWPATVALWLVDPLTVKQCSTDPLNDCTTIAKEEMCSNENDGVCITRLDGYYVESFLCVVVGFLWLQWGRKKILLLQNKPLSAWKVIKHKR